MIIPHVHYLMMFCTDCGSGFPFLSQNGKSLIIPAGFLNEEPSKAVDAQIFCSEQAEWHKLGLKEVKSEGFPK